VSMTMQEPGDRVAAQGAQFTRNTLRTALSDDVAYDGGGFLRLRQGVLTLRVDQASGARTGRAALEHVRNALEEMRAGGLFTLTRADVERHLASSGLQYSSRTVRDAMTRLVREPGEPLEHVGLGQFRYSRRTGLGSALCHQLPRGCYRRETL
jgi:hypothetical protein